MDIVQLFESGSTVALAVVVWYEVRAMRNSLDAFALKVTQLFTRDWEVRSASSVALGETLGRLDAQLAMLVDMQKLNQANGTDKYPSARREDLVG